MKTWLLEAAFEKFRTAKVKSRRLLFLPRWSFSPGNEYGAVVNEKWFTLKVRELGRAVRLLFLNSWNLLAPRESLAEALIDAVNPSLTSVNHDRVSILSVVEKKTKHNNKKTNSLITRDLRPYRLPDKRWINCFSFVTPGSIRWADESNECPAYYVRNWTCYEVINSRCSSSAYDTELL